MKKILSLTLLSTLVSCASLSEGGKKVQLVLVDGTARDIKKEKTKLAKDKCKFIKKVEAKVAAGSTPVTGRLIIGLKNKVAEVGGNAVISSLKTHGFPMHTYGLAYKCPVDASIDTDI